MSLAALYQRPLGKGFISFIDNIAFLECY